MRPRPEVAPESHRAPQRDPGRAVERTRPPRVALERDHDVRLGEPRPASLDHDHRPPRRERAHLGARQRTLDVDDDGGGAAARGEQVRELGPAVRQRHGVAHAGRLEPAERGLLRGKRDPRADAARPERLRDRERAAETVLRAGAAAARPQEHAHRGARPSAGVIP
jgi:hypothetical protein